MVWPTADPRHPNAPTADATLLSAVCSQLDARRLVTTELYVIPPTYHPVAVSIGIAVKTGYSALAVRRWVEMIVRQYLAPLPPFGPDGTGWPLGHRVHGPELEAAVVQVEGVDFVEELKVADLGQRHRPHGTVELAAWEVPELSEITVVAGSAPEPGGGGPPRRPIRCRCRSRSRRTSADDPPADRARARPPLRADHRGPGVGPLPAPGTVVDPVTAEVTLSGRARRIHGRLARRRRGRPPSERGWPSTSAAGCTTGVPERGQIERVPWPRATAVGGNVPVDLLADPARRRAARPVGFSAVAADPGRPLRARALAVDPDDHLFVLDGATGTIAVLDLTDGRLLRTIALAWPPVDLVARGTAIVVATSATAAPAGGDRRARRSAATPADTGADGPLAQVPARSRAAPRRRRARRWVWLLLRDEAAPGWCRMTGERLDQPHHCTPGAPDLEIDGDGAIVLAGPAGGDLLVWTVDGGPRTRPPPAGGRGTTGGGSPRPRTGAIGFWTARGFRLARPLRVATPRPADGWTPTGWTARTTGSSGAGCSSRPAYRLAPRSRSATPPPTTCPGRMRCWGRGRAAAPPPRRRWSSRLSHRTAAEPRQSAAPAGDRPRADLDPAGS